MAKRALKKREKMSNVVKSFEMLQENVEVGELKQNQSYEQHIARQPQVVPKKSESNRITGLAFLRFYDNKMQQREQLNTQLLRLNAIACKRKKKDIKGWCVKNIAVVNGTTIGCETTARYPICSSRYCR